MKLSVVMMIKNEAKHLEQCLMSIKPVQAAVQTEIVIVDTGSEDNSVGIARKYTDKVYFHQWENDFAAMRNITISYAKGEWVLVIDGDEVIEDPYEFIDFFQSNRSSKYNTGILRIKNFTAEDKKKYSLAFVPRLFKKDKELKFIGAIHEQANIKKPLYYFKSDILHYGYISTDFEQTEKKYLRNTQILINELKKNPDRIYYWYQLAQSYAAHGDYEEALEADLKAYEIAKKAKNLSNCMNVYHHLAIVYNKSKKYNELEEICLEALAMKNGYIDLYYFLAEAQVNLYKNNEAIRNYQIYLDMVSHYEDFAGSKDISVTSCTIDLLEHAYAELCVLYFKEKQFEMVLECKEKISGHDLLKYALPSVISAYIRLGWYSELKDFYETKILTVHETLVHIFTNSLEFDMSALGKQEKSLLIEIFSKGDSIYSFLNTIRIEDKLNHSCFNQAYITRLEGTDFNKLPIYYGEVFYYFLKHNRLSIETLANLRDKTLEVFFGYLMIQFKKECRDYILSFLLEEVEVNNVDNIRIRKALGKILIQSGMLEEENYEQVFNQYIKDGIWYINQIYSKNVIINEWIVDVKNEEEAMLIYMNHAEEMKVNDKVGYIRYLKKALAIYPDMAKGIEIYLKKFANELNSYKEAVKENIKTMIDTGNLLRAHKLIYEYERVQKDDIQILSMKAVIAIMENHLEEAEAIIKEGLGIEPKNFDLLYNLKYVYEAQGQEEKAELIQEKIAYSMPTARYIDSSISLEEFFEHVNEESIRYVVIRGHAGLPDIEQGDSLALLVHDGDLVKISKYFMPDQVEGAILCEVYSIREIPGSTTAALPDHPAEEADAMLENRVLYDGCIYIPCAQDFRKYTNKKMDA
ncbi:MAG TPA: glycosyltransferase [Patescibacteria group bacterium]|nr:glycosyltransferase [Patescibacteria group bacterium]